MVLDPECLWLAWPLAAPLSQTALFFSTAGPECSLPFVRLFLRACSYTPRVFCDPVPAPRCTTCRGIGSSVVVMVMPGVVFVMIDDE